MKRFHPDFCFDRFHCHSWLLSPELKKLLDPSSHILAFQGEFTLEKVDLDSEGYKLWLFKRGGLALQDAPENTSLQRRAQGPSAERRKNRRGSGLYSAGAHFVLAIRPALC